MYEETLAVRIGVIAMWAIAIVLGNALFLWALSPWSWFSWLVP